MAAQKLKAKDVKAFRETMVARQGNLCPLCDTELLPEDAVLDHSHDTGRIRFALHRSCNHSEGMIKNWAKRSRAKNKKRFALRVVQLWNEEFPHNPIHPSFKSADDKRLKILKNRYKNVKTEHAKTKIKAEVAEIMARIKLTGWFLTVNKHELECRNELKNEKNRAYNSTSIGTITEIGDELLFVQWR